MVISRLDYSNLLYAGLPLRLILKLQLVQNVVFLLTVVPMWVHIQPVLCQLNWLLTMYQIYIKMLVLTFKVLFNLGPTYLRDCSPHMCSGEACAWQPVTC